MSKENINEKLNKASIVIFILKQRAIIALSLLIIIFSLICPNFLTIQSLLIMIKHLALYAILAIGMTYVIVSGGIDLSVGSIVGFTGMMAGGFIHEGLVLPMFGITIYFNIVIVIIIVLILGIMAGGLNGLLITRFNITPFIATLGTMYIYRGLALLRSNGRTFPGMAGNPNLGNTGFPILGQAKILDIPIPIWIMAVLGLIAMYIYSAISTFFRSSVIKPNFFIRSSVKSSNS